jgi:hypothetical protein
MVSELADVLAAELVDLMPRRMALTLPISTLRFIDAQCAERGLSRGEYLGTLIAEID